jgi:hypothetical protein
MADRDSVLMCLFQSVPQTVHVSFLPVEFYRTAPHINAADRSDFGASTRRVQIPLHPTPAGQIREARYARNWAFDVGIVSAPQYPELP